MLTRKRDKAETELLAKAKKVLPGGTFGNFAADVVITDGKGGRVWDASGNEYVDYVLGSGPMLVGHAHPEVLEAVHARLNRGTTFFANNDAGILLAEEIVSAVPCAEKVRFTSSGSEATLYAMRAIRSYRKRSKILKFEGGFHGMNDYSLMSLAPTRRGNGTDPVPSSAGIPDSLRDEVLIAPFNNLEIATAIIDQHHDELAGVIVEPFQRVIPPKPGFLQGLRDVTARHKVPLIFDEIVTGFRFAYGGAQEFYGVVPDMCTLGKTIGGGFPLAAVAGRDSIMAHFDKAASGEEGFMPMVGTLSGNPIAATAGLATLKILKRPGSYEKIFATGRTLMANLSKALKAVGIPAQVVGEGCMFDVVLTNQSIVDYWSSKSGDESKQKLFDKILLDNGVIKGNSKFYVSLAHDEADIATTTKAFEAAAEALAQNKAA
ncbi:MAG: aminotransferase class III-fold pyridoxal phosphate-dependent enzyme [Alphaproteobacteria bacterium]